MNYEPCCDGHAVFNEDFHTIDCETPREGLDEPEPDIDAIEEQIKEQEEIEKDRIGREQADWAYGRNDLNLI